VAGVTENIQLQLKFDVNTLDFNAFRIDPIGICQKYPANATLPHFAAL
jgi:hypothetical protein